MMPPNQNNSSNLAASRRQQPLPQVPVPYAPGLTVMGFAKLTSSGDGVNWSWQMQLPDGAGGWIGGMFSSQSNLGTCSVISGGNSSANSYGTIYQCMHNNTSGSVSSGLLFAPNNTSSGTTSGSQLLFTKKNGTESTTSGNNFTSATVTGVSAITGCVFRAKASGSWTSLGAPTIGATLNIGNATSSATAVSGVTANAGWWYFEAEMTMALVAAGTSASIVQSSARMHENNLILGVISSNLGIGQTGSQSAFTATQLLAGTGTVTLTNLGNTTMILEAFTLEKLSP